MNARADFEQAECEQEHQQHLLAVLVRVEHWQRSREDVLLLAAELGLTNVFQQENSNAEHQ